MDDKSKNIIGKGQVDPHAFYEKEAKVYDNKRHYEGEAGRNDKIQQAIVNDLMEFTPEKKYYLEIGTGTGRFALNIAKKGFNVIVVDISKEMLLQTRKKFANAGLLDKVTLIQADINALPFKDGVIDEILCINVMSHIDTYREALKEISRVLADNGGITINFPNLISVKLPVGLLVNLRKKAIFRNVFTRWYDTKRIEIFLKEIGIKVVRCAGQPPGVLSNVNYRGFVSGNKLSNIEKFMSGIIFFRGERGKP